MELWTIQIAQWRKLKDTGIQFLDTTVKSGDPVFAPNWDIVTRSKAGTLSNDDYTDAYLALMRVSYRRNYLRWQEIMHSPDPIAIACYCKAGAFCHRCILAGIFSKACYSEGIPFVYHGEFLGV